MSKLRWHMLLMGLVILLVTGFQSYWLRDNYRRERQALELKTDALFHETVLRVQDSIFQEKWEVMLDDSTNRRRVKGNGFMRPSSAPGGIHPVRLISRLRQRQPGDSIIEKHKGRGVYISVKGDAPFKRPDTGRVRFLFDSMPPDDIREVVIVNGDAKAKSRSDSPGRMQRSGQTRMLTVAETMSRDSNPGLKTEVNTIFFDNEKGDRFKIRLDSLIADSIPLTVLQKTFEKALAAQALDIPFNISRDNEELRPDTAEFLRRPFFDMIGGYKVQLGNTFPYIIRQIFVPILFSVFLAGITAFALVMLYRSLLKQRRLSVLKNDLISNITHELKTPIATVGVAIEALRSFNAIRDPEKTREYLDISHNELQRLELLVDKVLKLSMFEKKEIELKYESFELEDVVNEVVSSLRLQAEKKQASISVQVEGHTVMRGDRLHLLSVVFNLLDNALKYSSTNPLIHVLVKEEQENLVLSVKDNGVGIPPRYHDKIFEKFFRVPTGDMHDAKGYGLGLSYAAHVMRQHSGQIKVESQEGIGSTFTIVLPKHTNI